MRLIIYNLGRRKGILYRQSQRPLGIINLNTAIIVVRQFALLFSSFSFLSILNFFLI